MNRLTQNYQLYTQTERDGRLPALDGARALFVLFVGCYHIWQQSWLTPNISIFGYYTSLDPWLRSGYIWVDAMLLLSGFLLYLPHAEAAENGGKTPSIWQFYKKRLLRIVPSYYLCVLIMLIFVALPGGSYNNPDGTFNAWYMGRDLLAHATFTHTLFRFSYIGSPLNGSLWTLGVEMQFYLVFPLVARLFRKKPALCYAGMLAVAFGYRAWVATLPDTTLYFNQLPAQLDVYANGMALAGIYCAIKRRTKQDGWTRALFTGVLIVACCLIVRLISAQAGESGYDHIRLGQMNRRFLFSAAVGLSLLGLLYGAQPLRLLMGNRVTRILSEISFQFYMWHQVFAVQLKRWNIPVSEYETPWTVGDRTWQYLYVALCFAGALAISVLVTYAFEQPIARLGRGRRAGRKNK